MELKGTTATGCVWGGLMLLIVKDVMLYRIQK